MDDEILWMVAQYCAYVYGQSNLMLLYAINQKSQNVLAHIPF
jgi:hypothetical protein